MFSKYNVSINTSDLELLQKFLSREIVCYFVQKIKVRSDSDLIFLSHGVVTAIIEKLQLNIKTTNQKFNELSFTQKMALMADVINNGNFCF